MRILHAIAGMSPGDGGPTKAVFEMARAVARRGHQVTILATNKDGAGVLDVPTDRPIHRDGVELRYYPVQFPRFFRFSRPLSRALADEIPRSDVVHVHSLYLFHDLVSSRECQRSRVPYVVRPHGSLDPYLFRRHRWRKKLLEVWFQDRMLRGAAGIHYTADEERELAEPHVFGAPGFVIPNGLEPSAYEDLPRPGSFRSRYPEIGDKKLILFFGRLNFKKGLDVLVDAFDRVRQERDDVHLVLAGPDGGMRAKVDRWLCQRGIREDATFTGMVQGTRKLELLRDGDLFVLPSYSENFGIAVIEAAVCKMPVLISNRVNIWSAIESAGAGVVTPPSAKEFSDSMLWLLRDDERRREMGGCGEALVRERFAWDRIAGKLEGMYREVAQVG